LELHVISVIEVLSVWYQYN